MADFPDGTNFADNPPDHPNTDLWRDVPRSGRWVTVRDEKGRKAKIWKATSRGAIVLPTSASRLAEHAELVGYVLDPNRALIRRIDPVRGGKNPTNPGTWQDITAPIPDADPVHEVAVQATSLLPHELLDLHQRIGQQIEDMK